MKYTTYKTAPYFLLLIISLLSFNCNNDDDIEGNEEIEEVTLNDEVNDFVWRGLNEIYLWMDDVADLADNRFSSENEYYTFLNNYNTPEDAFYNLLYQYQTVDKFSYLVDDYVELENSFSGTSLSNGLDFRLAYISSDSENIMGYVRYIANNSDAASKDIERGDFFLTVNGTQMTSSNYYDLLFSDNTSYTLGLAEVSNNTISLNGETVNLTKTEFTENPILINKTIETNGFKIGYLMYNQFVSDFDAELNNIFAEFKSQGITDLVLDLRYNPGGYVSSAINISSMITGQFNDQVFSTEEWNSKYQAYFENNSPSYLINNFTNTLSDNVTAINSLNLTKVYILTTGSSASASELVINCLDAYIDVIHIGTTTTGKYTASVTLYDSENFSKENVNTNHTYALQPLVYKSANADGVTDYYNGLTPDYTITYESSSGVTYEGENISNLGILGDETEPFLAKAIELITGTTTKNNYYFKNISELDVKKYVDAKDFTPLGKNMISVLKTTIKN